MVEWLGLKRPAFADDAQPLGWGEWKRCGHELVGNRRGTADDACWFTALLRVVLSAAPRLALTSVRSFANRMSLVERSTSGQLR